MNDKRNISSEAAIDLARKLNFSAEELSYFHDLVELAQAKTENLKDVIRYRLTKYGDNQSCRTVQVVIDCSSETKCLITLAN
ncbi:MAG: hypothetical protein H7326_05665 [Bdellovibrionaceae bacterium]|nr:hypothetical protein [Pseudobdellovibrionaceae bacterium]